jgi:hypothetical protein
VLINAEDARQYTYLRNLKKKTLLGYRAEVIFKPFSHWKFKQIPKNGFGRKNRLSTQFLHIAKFRKF